MKRIIDWRIFFILLCLSLLSIIAVLPYVLTLQGDLLRQIGQPLTLIILAQVLQSAVLFSVAIFLGLWLSRIIHFRLPFLEALVAHRNYMKVLKEITPISILLGIVCAISIYTVDHLFTVQGVSITTSQSYAPIWQKLLAAFYGGISEEILMRLFLMALFIRIGMLVTRQTQPSRGVIIISIVLASVIFGLGHLPITSALTAITPMVVARAIVLNGIGGIVFGWLYWKKGLEAAIISHFTADIFLLTILPMIIK